MTNILKINGQWFHRTEDEQIRGPFVTRSQAEIELKLYLTWLNTGVNSR